MDKPTAEPKKSQGQMRSLLIGGLLPVVAYTIVEETFGIFWGLVAGMVLATGEILWEWKTRGKVDPVTWTGSGFILVLGTVSLFTQEGLWFRLQPAILEGVFGVALIVSVLMGKPFLLLMARKQGILEKFPPPVVPFFEKTFSGLTLRIAIFFLLHAVLATYAALYWSTRQWALLKGVGFTGTMLIYMVLEGLWLRHRLGREIQSLRKASNPREPHQHKG